MHLNKLLLFTILIFTVSSINLGQDKSNISIHYPKNQKSKKSTEILFQIDILNKKVISNNQYLSFYNIPGKMAMRYPDKPCYLDIDDEEELLLLVNEYREIELSLDRIDQNQNYNFSTYKFNANRCTLTNKRGEKDD